MQIFDHNKKIEPPDDAEVWRFLKMDYFRDLIANEELFFCRTDKYKTDDPNEGLPTDRYLRRTLKLKPYVLEDELTLNSHQASNRLFSESYYLSCWNLFNEDNRLRMWYRYAPCGVAIRSQYGRLKAALNAFLDEVYLGKVRYGDQEMTGYNQLQIIFTKAPEYSWENELRVVVCSHDPVGGQARNYRETNFPYREPQDDLNPIHPWVHPYKRRRVRMNDLLVGIMVSPWATDETFKEVQQWANLRGQKLGVETDLKSPLTPTIKDLKARGWGRAGAGTEESECV